MTSVEHFFPPLTEAFRVFGFFALFALLPFVLVLMTSFTRISIILTFLRQALSTSIPSAQIIFGLSIILTAYVMHPVFTEISKNAVMPYFKKEFVAEKGGKGSEEILIEKAWPPLRNFMLLNTREKDLELFLEMSKVELPSDKAFDVATLPWFCVIPAFVVSELRIAFMIGFLLFLPFLVIDMVVTSVLMSMGMFMLPPTMISFPFKLLLFVVVDGWHLIVQQLVGGFQI